MVSSKVKSGLKNFKERLISRSERSDRTYIVPTSFGFLFGLIVLVLFIFALGFQNNIVYMFVFFITSVGMTVMFVTNSNVQSVIVEPVALGLVFAGEKNQVPAMVTQTKERAAQCLQLSLKKCVVSIDLLHKEETQQVILDWEPLEIGFHRPPRVVLESVFPMGVMRAWKVFRTQHQTAVYPARRGKPLQQIFSNGEVFAQDKVIFKGLDPFQVGDSIHRIDWRSSLRHHKHLVKRFSPEEQAKDIRFEWQPVNSRAEVLSQGEQISLWLCEAEVLCFRYSLDLRVDEKSEFGKGPIFLKQQLDRLLALVMFEIEKLDS